MVRWFPALLCLLSACSTTSTPLKGGRAGPVEEAYPDGATRSAAVASTAVPSASPQTEGTAGPAAPAAQPAELPGGEPAEPPSQPSRWQGKAIDAGVKQKLDPFRESPNFEILLEDASNESVASLAKIPWLKNLRIYGSSVTDLTPIAGLKALKVFNAGDCSGIADVRPLANLGELAELTLSRTSVTDIAPLSKLSKLQRLRLNGTAVTDLGPLKSLSGLKELHLRAIKAKDWGPISTLAELEDVDFEETDLKDLGLLAKATRLRRLNVIGTKRLTDISALAAHSELDTLELTNSAVKDLTPLAKLSKLRFVYLSGVQAADLSALETSAKSGELRSISVSKALAPAAQALKKRFPRLDVTVF
jgi:hypothetical protein